jgi:predicted molibdopterin-dependent oxidoreductase YjgC
MKLDGRDVQPRGSLLDTILANGIDLPHLCKDDNLPVIGACRTCLVEADGRIVAACSTPAGSVSECATSSERATRVRRGVLSLTAAMQGPGTSSLAGGPCSGETAAAFTAHHVDSHRLPFRTGAHTDASTPFFSFHEDACILCGRCTTACQDLQHIGAIGIAGRGQRARVTPGAGVAFADSVCTSCGSCVAACPTTALSPRE